MLTLALTLVLVAACSSRDSDGGLRAAGRDTALSTGESAATAAGDLERRASPPNPTRDSVGAGSTARSATQPDAPAATVAAPARPSPRRVPPGSTKPKQGVTGTGARTLPKEGERQDVDREIARAVAAWSRVRTLRASFEQTVTNPLTGSELVARGTLQQQKPGRLAITFSEPAGDRIVADGEYVWVFLQSATPGQVVRMRVTDAGAANTDLIGQFLNTPRGSYDASDVGRDVVGGRPARALLLTARPGRSLPFMRAKVWLDSADALIRQFESVDGSGVSRKVRIVSLTPNAAVDTAAFRFRVPAGVRIVDR